MFGKDLTWKRSITSTDPKRKEKEEINQKKKKKKKKRKSSFRSFIQIVNLIKYVKHFRIRYLSIALNGVRYLRNKSNRFQNSAEIMSFIP